MLEPNAAPEMSSKDYNSCNVTTGNVTTETTNQLPTAMNSSEENKMQAFNVTSEDKAPQDMPPSKKQCVEEAASDNKMNTNSDTSSIVASVEHAEDVVEARAAANALQEKDEEAKTKQFFQALTNGAWVLVDGEKKFVKGLLRSRTRKQCGVAGRPNLPYHYQRRAVKRIVKMVKGEILHRRFLLCHDAGLGKTFTFLMVKAALHITNGGRRENVLISAPTSCILQWVNAVLDALCIPSDEVFSTNQMSAITRSTLRKHTVIIVSKDLIARAYGNCFEYVTRHHQNATGHWLGGWEQKANVVLHPIFATSFALFGVDEAHNMRNPTTRVTKGHELIATNSTRVIGLSATPLFTRPGNLGGLAVCLDMHYGWYGTSNTVSFKEQSSYYLDKARQKVNIPRLLQFAENMDRATDSMIKDLPPLNDFVVDFDAGIDFDSIYAYNMVLVKAKRLRALFNLRNGGTQKEINDLQAYLSTLQQFLVSPLLAVKTAKVVSTDSDLLEECSRQETGLKYALKLQIQKLQSEGFANVLVAACHTAVMEVAKRYMAREAPDVGDLMMYYGGLTLKKRAEMQSRFLNSQRSVMFMSIDAGGTGLHLVPGCNAVIFCLSRPYSPMQILQTKKRIHRIGQTKPVKVVHLIAKGSVDHAISFVHDDKTNLAKVLMEKDVSLMSNDGKWRTHGRIVDTCRWLDPATGNFADESVTEQDIIQHMQSRAYDQNEAEDDDGVQRVDVLEDEDGVQSVDVLEDEDGVQSVGDVEDEPLVPFNQAAFPDYDSSAMPVFTPVQV